MQRRDPLEVEFQFHHNKSQFCVVPLRHLEDFCSANLIDRRCVQKIQQVDGGMCDATELKVDLKSE